MNNEQFDQIVDVPLGQGDRWQTYLLAEISEFARFGFGYQTRDDATPTSHNNENRLRAKPPSTYYAKGTQTSPHRIRAQSNPGRYILQTANYYLQSVIPLTEGKKKKKTEPYACLESQGTSQRR